MELRRRINFPVNSITLLLAVLLSCRFPHSVSTNPCDFPAIFNFGDSNSDTGGYSAAFGQAKPPNGMSFFNGPAGRYCDGRLVIDFIAERFKLPYLNAYLDALGLNFTHGANFATAGSTIRPANPALLWFSPFSLNVQWNQFNDFRRRVQNLRTKSEDEVITRLVPRIEDFSHALYTFDMGQNDLVAGLIQNMSIDQVKESIPDIVGQLIAVIKDIYDQGGRSFWIHNTGPLGCLAYMLDLELVMAREMNEYGCSRSLNELAQSFNHHLKESIDRLREDLPKASITYVDVYSVKYTLITQATRYGFVDPLRVCCGHGGKYNYNMSIGCGGKAKIDGKEVMMGKPCDDPTVMINWDGGHYTQAANKWVFDHIVNGSFSDPPTPLGFACHQHTKKHDEL